MPFPSMPLGFWNDPDGRKYRAAYFETFPGVWRHGDYVELTEHDGMIIYGRSDAVLNPGGVRIGTAEIYRQVEQLDEIVESLVIGQQWDARRADRPVRPAARRPDADRRSSRIASGGTSARTRRRATCRRASCRSRRSRGRRAARSSSWPCATSSTAARSRTARRSRTRRRWSSSGIDRNCGTDRELSEDPRRARLGPRYGMRNASCHSQRLPHAIGSFGGVFKDLSAADLGAIVIREAIARAGIDAKDIGDVIMGCVLQAGAGMNVARQAAHQGGRAGRGAGRDDQPRLRIRAAGGRARGRGGQGRLRRPDRSPAAPSR